MVPGNSRQSLLIYFSLTEYDVIAITYQVTNSTHTSLRQVTINIYAQQIDPENEIAAVKDASATFTYSTNVTPSNIFITIWSLSTNTTIFNGQVVDLTGANPTVQFSVPAADPSQAIARLILAPFSSDSFAITQAYTATTTASFTNYYTLSSCNTTGFIALLDCSQNNYACRCACNEYIGWHDTGDGVTCKTGNDCSFPKLNPHPDFDLVILIVRLLTNINIM